MSLVYWTGRSLERFSGHIHTDNVVCPVTHLQGSLNLTLSARLYTSESDVCGRQILTYKDDPRTEIIEIFIMAVDP